MENKTRRMKVTALSAHRSVENLLHDGRSVVIRDIGDGKCDLDVYDRGDFEVALALAKSGIVDTIGSIVETHIAELSKVHRNRIEAVESTVASVDKGQSALTARVDALETAIGWNTDGVPTNKERGELAVQESKPRSFDEQRSFALSEIIAIARQVCLSPEEIRGAMERDAAK